MASATGLLCTNRRNDVGDILHLRLEGDPERGGPKGVEPTVFSAARNDADVDIGLLLQDEPTRAFRS